MQLHGKINEIIARLATAKLDPEKEYDCEIGEKRSLDANAYYWALIGQYARWTRKSKVYWHNDIMERFGEEEQIDGQTVYIMLPDSIRYKEYPKMHLKWTRHTKTGKDGKAYRWFIKMQDSHTYNRKQFSRLIDGIIDEIQGSEAPIETMTRDELESLKGYEATL